MGNDSNRINIKTSNFKRKLGEVMTWTEKHKAVVWYPFEQTIERVGITISPSSEIVIDKLPLYGAGNKVSYWPDQYEKDFIVLKGKVLSYWDAMFPKPDKLYLLMYLNTGELKLVKYKVAEPEDVEGDHFYFEFQDGSEGKWYARDAYEKTFILLNPSKGLE